MATQVKHRRGTAAQNASFTGAEGEFVYTTDTKRIGAHDGSTAGGKTFLNATDIQNKVGVGDTTVGGTANAITLTHTFPRTAHTTGAEIQFKATADNSGAVTVAIDSIAGTKALEKMVAGTATALVTGDIKNGVVYTAIYDGTRYQLQGSAGAAVTTQAEMEAASNNTSMVTPLAVNWHPGVAKCWGKTTGGGSPSLGTSHNITSITDVTTGTLTVTIATDFSGATQTILALADHNSSTVQRTVQAEPGTYSAGDFQLRAFVSDSTDGALADPSHGYYWACFGDQ